MEHLGVDSLQYLRSQFSEDCFKEQELEYEVVILLVKQVVCMF